MDEEELEDEELNEEDEEDEEDQEQEMQEEEDKKKKLEEKALKTKLTIMAGRLVAKGDVVLNAQDKKTVKDAKKHKPLKEDINRINAILIANKVKKTMQTVGKVASSGPALWYVVLGALIIFLIICVIVIIVSIVQSATGAGGGSEFGINGKDFYGARMVYKNDEIASVCMVEDYVELVENGINSTTAIKTASKDGKTYNVEVSVNIALPEEDYNFEEFDEAEFQAEYAVLYETIFDIAKIVYKVDNNAETTATTLIECVDGILYFGYGETAMAEISTLLTDKIVENITFTSKDDSEHKLTIADIQNVATPKLTTLYAEAKYAVRTEKLFIKDFILESDDAKVSGVTAENYIAMIFMPKKNVTINKFSFVAGGENLSDLTVELFNNGSSINIIKDDADYGQDLPTEEGEEETEQPKKEAYIYMTNEDLGITVETYQDIDENNLTALKDGMSLYDVVEKVNDYSIYLELSTQSQTIQFYTFKLNGVYVKLNCSNPFAFTEFETLWEAN